MMSLSWPLENKVSLFCNCVEYLVRSSFLGAGGTIRVQGVKFSADLEAGHIWLTDQWQRGRAEP